MNTAVGGPLQRRARTRPRLWAISTTWPTTRRSAASRAWRSTATLGERARVSAVDQGDCRINVLINYDTANCVFYGGVEAADDIGHHRALPRARSPQGHARRDGSGTSRRSARATSTSPRPGSCESGLHGPFTVEIEFIGRTWPPLEEVNRSMQGRPTARCRAGLALRSGGAMLKIGILGAGFMGGTHAAPLPSYPTCRSSAFPHARSTRPRLWPRSTAPSRSPTR